MTGRKPSKPPATLESEMPPPAPMAMELPEMEAAAEGVRRRQRRRGRASNILAGAMMGNQKQLLG